MLSLKNFSVSVGDKEILHNLSVVFHPGKIYAIMGPNGSGKSTLARAIMGDPSFHIGTDALMTLTCENTTHDLKELSTDKRARLGIFLSQQSPPTIDGVTVRDVLRASLMDVRKKAGHSALDLKKEIEKTARTLAIPVELLDRSLNDGFSGGERKKMEVLQMALLDPHHIILDEIDTGVDVDALKTIATFLADYIKDTTKTLIIITHSTRILHHLPPEQTIILRNGQIVATGDITLAQRIEEHGFDVIAS